jgi:hypothetical protein
VVKDYPVEASQVLPEAGIRSTDFMVIFFNSSKSLMVNHLQALRRHTL